MKKKRYCKLLICHSVISFLILECFLLVTEVELDYSQFFLVSELKFAHPNKTEHFVTIEHLFNKTNLNQQKTLCGSV